MTSIVEAPRLFVMLLTPVAEYCRYVKPHEQQQQLVQHYYNSKNFDTKHYYYSIILRYKSYVPTHLDTQATLHNLLQEPTVCT